MGTRNLHEFYFHKTQQNIDITPVLISKTYCYCRFVRCFQIVLNIFIVFYRLGNFRLNKA